jgi:hypothetical protein
MDCRPARTWRRASPPLRRFARSSGSTRLSGRSHRAPSRPTRACPPGSANHSGSLRAGRPACDSHTRPSATATTTLALADRNATSCRTRVDRSRRPRRAEYLEVVVALTRKTAPQVNVGDSCEPPGSEPCGRRFQTAMQCQTDPSGGPNGDNCPHANCDAPAIRFSSFAASAVRLRRPPKPLSKPREKQQPAETRQTCSFCSCGTPG